MDVGPLFGLILIPAIVGAAAGLVYWLAAGRPRSPSVRS
jgi:hypothetical protein